jgi:hypothetical protein
MKFKKGQLTRVNSHGLHPRKGEVGVIIGPYNEQFATIEEGAFRLVYQVMFEGGDIFLLHEDYLEHADETTGGE